MHFKEVFVVVHSKHDDVDDRGDGQLPDEMDGETANLSA